MAPVQWVHAACWIGVVLVAIFVLFQYAGNLFVVLQRRLSRALRGVAKKAGTPATRDTFSLTVDSNGEGGRPLRTKSMHKRMSTAMPSWRAPECHPHGMPCASHITMPVAGRPSACPTRACSTQPAHQPPYAYTSLLPLPSAPLPNPCHRPAAAAFRARPRSGQAAQQSHRHTEAGDPQGPSQMAHMEQPACGLCERHAAGGAAEAGAAGEQWSARGWGVRPGWGAAAGLRQWLAGGQGAALSTLSGVCSTCP